MAEGIASALFARHHVAVMGIVNVTPDSFSDGGDLATPAAAVDRASAMLGVGAELVDVGGESTRPGSRGVSVEEELDRVMPVLTGVLERSPGALLSVDTSKVEVARRALDAGAGMVNDVTAGAAEGMLELAAERGAAVVLMHMRGTPRTMQADTRYGDVVEEVRAHLLGRAEAAVRAGVPEARILLDPGIGFGKDLEGNLALLRGLPRLAEAGFPVLVGTSRKSFLGKLTGAGERQRLGATLASLLPAFGLERVVVRVHDVEEVVRFRAVWEAIYSPGRPKG